MPALQNRRTLTRWVVLALLAAYAVQCLWLIRALPMDDEEAFFAFRYAAHQSWPAERVAEIEREHSPLIFAIARAVPWRAMPFGNPKMWLRLPMLVIGLLLGASVWHIANRWYGAGGGLIALALYCFSPAMVSAGAHLWPLALAAWGFYGTIFTAMACAHTLYAAPGALPRQKRWRNVVLFGLALGVGVAADFAVALALPFAVAFALYLVAGRRWAVLRMLAVGCAIAALILFAVYGFDPAAFTPAFAHAQYAGTGNLSWRAPRNQLMMLLASSLPLAVLWAISVITWVWCRGSRWFGNTAPLLIAGILPLFWRAHTVGASAARSVVLPFVALFVGGVFSDLMHARRQKIWNGIALFLVLSSVVLGVWTVMEM